MPTAAQAVWDVTDHGTLTLDSSFWAPKADRRERAGRTARLADQFLQMNRAALAEMGIDPRVAYDGASARLELRASDMVGGIALRSPTTGMHDLGLVVRPRFAWRGLGPTWLETGWTVVPTILGGPQLPQSDRRTPLWVLSSVVLHRLSLMLRQIDRRFAMQDAVLPAPRGGVRWDQYAAQHLPRAQFTSVPCRVPVLERDHDLRGVIHLVLRQQRAALMSVKSDGGIVVTLLEFCNRLLQSVADTTPRPPMPGELERWGRSRTLANLRPGLEAIEWTVEERGLAGLADLRGLPWKLPMNEFFEAWVERLARELVVRVGGVLRSGRLRETLSPIQWNPPFTGSQRYLLPDLVLETEDHTVVLDAKYKRHWRELSQEPWHSVGEELREEHRRDLLQVLAYSSLFDARRVSCVLVYPCEESTWDHLEATGQTVQRAEVQGGSRHVDIFLAAIPFGRRPRDIAGPMIEALVS